MLLTRASRAAAALIGWFAVFLQYGLHLFGPGGVEPLGVTVEYFSYFTVLTNMLAATAMTASALAPETAAGRFFSGAPARTAIALYIVVVAAVYHFILSHQWAPEGWRLLADTLLHYVAPAWFAADWLLLTDKRGLRFGLIGIWLAYPLGYGAYALARGALTGEYPYFFLAADELGYAVVARNLAGLLAVFALGGAVLIGLARVLERRRAATA